MQIGWIYVCTCMNMYVMVCTCMCMYTYKDTCIYVWNAMHKFSWTCIKEFSMFLCMLRWGCIIGKRTCLLYPCSAWSWDCRLSDEHPAGDYQNEKSTCIFGQVPTQLHGWSRICLVRHVCYSSIQLTQLLNGEKRFKPSGVLLQCIQ